MILSDKSIRLNGIVLPFDEQMKFRGKSYGISSCGYDVRVYMPNLQDFTEYPHVMTPDGDGIALDPGKSVLLGIMEHFHIPPGVVGFAKDKSTWSRQGLFVAQAVLEPGWKGYLVLRVFNMGDEPLTIVHGEPIAQIVFQWIDDVPDNTYTGKYHNQGKGPQGPR